MLLSCCQVRYLQQLLFAVPLLLCYVKAVDAVIPVMLMPVNLQAFPYTSYVHCVIDVNGVTTSLLLLSQGSQHWTYQVRTAQMVLSGLEALTLLMRLLLEPQIVPTRTAKKQTLHSTRPSLQPLLSRLLKSTAQRPHHKPSS